MALNLSQKKSIGPSGLAEVKVLSKVVRIEFADGDIYEIPLDGWDKARGSGKYVVTLNKGCDKAVGVKPPAGTYLVKFNKFANRIDEIPQTRIQKGRNVVTDTGKKFTIPDKLVFDALLSVVNHDKYEDLNILLILPYGFEPEPGTPNTIISVSGKRDLENIEKFLRFAGYDFNKDMPYSPNVLPFLEEDLRRQGKIFMVTIGEKGFIDTMAEVPESLLPKAKKGKK